MKHGNTNSAIFVVLSPLHFKIIIRSFKLGHFLCKNLHQNRFPKIFLKYLKIVLTRSATLSSLSEVIFSFAGLNLCEYKGCVVSTDSVASGLMEDIANFEVQVQCP